MPGHDRAVGQQRLPARALEAHAAGRQHRAATREHGHARLVGVGAGDGRGAADDDVVGAAGALAAGALGGEEVVVRRAADDLLDDEAVLDAVDRVLGDVTSFLSLWLILCKR